MKRFTKGFTLIELLVVIAVLGVLATVVIVAINPLQQLAKARDGGRLDSIGQLGNAINAYQTSNNNAFPPTGVGATGWDGIITASGDISVIPAQVTNASGTYCVTNVINGWCYNRASATGPAIVYSLLEAATNTAKCSLGATTAAWALYSTADGKAGIVCTASSATQPTVPAAGTAIGTCANTPCTTANKFVQ